MAQRFLQLGVSSFLSIALARCLLPNLLGCSVLLSGAGERSVGMRNDNFLVFKHSVDGDKQDVTSKATLEADALLDLVVGGGDVEASEAEPVSSSSPN